jgi:enoyl-CoA hydratase
VRVTDPAEDDRRDVSVDVVDHVATVTIDRPPVNAVSTETMAEIARVFRAFDDDRDVRAVVFTGAGTRAFVGGADLRALGDDDPATWPPSRLVDRGVVARDALWSIYDCAVPVVAAINGPAIGAGLALAAVCDVIVAAEGATFAATEINVGLLGASAHLSMLVGRHKARELYLTGEPITVEELHRLGVVRSVVPATSLRDEATALAATLAAKSPIAMRLAKQAMNRVEFLPLKEAYRIEQDYTGRILAFEDATEARTAYLEKREPEWRWR